MVTCNLVSNVCQGPWSCDPSIWNRIWEIDPNEINLINGRNGIYIIRYLVHHKVISSFFLTCWDACICNVVYLSWKFSTHLCVLHHCLFSSSSQISFFNRYISFGGFEDGKNYFNWRLMMFNTWQWLGCHHMNFEAFQNTWNWTSESLFRYIHKERKKERVYNNVTLTCYCLKLLLWFYNSCLTSSKYNIYAWDVLFVSSRLVSIAEKVELWAFSTSWEGDMSICSLWLIGLTMENIGWKRVIFHSGIFDNTLYSWSHFFILYKPCNLSLVFKSTTISMA